jgi:hypothetical protein
MKTPTPPTGSAPAPARPGAAVRALGCGVGLALALGALGCGPGLRDALGYVTEIDAAPVDAPPREDARPPRADAPPGGEGGAPGEGDAGPSPEPLDGPLPSVCREVPLDGDTLTLEGATLSIPRRALGRPAAICLRRVNVTRRGTYGPVYEVEVGLDGVVQMPLDFTLAAAAPEALPFEQLALAYLQPSMKAALRNWQPLQGGGADPARGLLTGKFDRGAFVERVATIAVVRSCGNGGSSICASCEGGVCQ